MFYVIFDKNRIMPARFKPQIPSMLKLWAYATNKDSMDWSMVHLKMKGLGLWNKEISRVFNFELHYGEPN